MAVELEAGRIGRGDIINPQLLMAHGEQGQGIREPLLHASLENGNGLQLGPEEKADGSHHGLAGEASSDDDHRAATIAFRDIRYECGEISRSILFVALRSKCIRGYWQV